jgi:hypothetical protein
LFFIQDIIKRPVFSAIFIFLILTFVLASPLLLSIFPSLEGNRMFAFLSLEADSSYSQRQILRSLGTDIIQHHFFLGDYANNAQRFGMAAYYTHDITDVWGQFGLIPFTLLCLSTLFAGISAFTNLVRRKGTPAALYLLLFTVLCWQFSRNQSFAYLFFPIGLASAFNRNEFK